MRAVSGVVTYNNPDPANIRNILDVGGGGIMDIGCYMIYFSRFAFAAEPMRAISLVDRDPAMKTDRIASVLLQFPQGQASVRLLDAARPGTALPDPRHVRPHHGRDADQHAQRPPDQADRR